MRNALRMTVLFGAVASTGLAQTDFHCKLEGSSLIGHRDGVAEYEVDTEYRCFPLQPKSDERHRSPER